MSFFSTLGDFFKRLIPSRNATYQAPTIAPALPDYNQYSNAIGPLPATAPVGSSVTNTKTGYAAPNVAPRQTTQIVQSIPTQQFAPGLQLPGVAASGSAFENQGTKPETNTLQDFITQFQNLTPEQKQFLGIGETPEQKTYRESLTATLGRLTSLQEELAKTNAPTAEQQKLDTQIEGLQTQLNRLTPEGLLKSQPGLQNVGLTQDYLERRAAKEKEPIARTLSDLLISRSKLGQMREQERTSLQAQLQGLTGGLQLQQAIAGLQPKSGIAGLPSAVQNTLFEQLFKKKAETQKPTSDIQEYEYALKTGAIPKGTSFVDYQRTIANLKAPKTTNIFGAFGGENTLDQMANAVMAGNLAPSQLPGFGANSLKAQVIAKVSQLNPQFDFQKAETDFEAKKKYTGYINSPTYQNTIKYLDSIQPNLDEVIRLSDNFKRFGFMALNKAQIFAKAQTGDPLAAQYQAAVIEVADQVAKILQGGGTGSGTSDAKLRQAVELLNTNYSARQFKAVAKELRVLLANRKASLEKDTIKTIGQQQEAEKKLTDEEAYQLYLQK